MKKRNIPEKQKQNKSSSLGKSSREPKQKVGYTLDWKRAIYINKAINETLLKELTPVILQLKQDNSSPITVGIDSPGGNIGVMESLLSLLKCPDQDGKVIEIYTVATDKACSAAADFLAFGDYSVAFPHSKILYHDVRYSDIDDVTSSKALRAARLLEKGNTAFSLRLAKQIQTRLIWVYIDLKSRFNDVRKRFPKIPEKYDKIFSELVPSDQKQIVDIVGFALALFSELSSPNDGDIAIEALRLLASCVQIEKIEKMLSDRKSEGKIDPVDGISDLVGMIEKLDLDQPNSLQISESIVSTGLSESIYKDIRLFLEVLARRLVIDKNESINDSWLDKLINDFIFMKDINDSVHVKATISMLVGHYYTFFDTETTKMIKGTQDQEEQSKLLVPFYPQVRLFWYYIVLICRCLCRGEHILTPRDAQVLGLVDEVLGGGAIQSRREWRKTQPGYE